MPVLLVCPPWKVSSRLIRYSCQLLKGTFAKTIRRNLKLVLPQRRGNSNNSLTLKSHLERGRGASNPPALSHHRVLPHCLHPMTAPGSEISSLCIISPFPFFFSFLFCYFPFFFLFFPPLCPPSFSSPPFFCFVFNLGQRQAFESYSQVYCTAQLQMPNLCQPVSPTRPHRQWTANQHSPLSASNLFPRLMRTRTVFLGDTLLVTYNQQTTQSPPS